MITSTKKALFHQVNPFVINDFSFKDKGDFTSRFLLKIKETSQVEIYYQILLMLLQIYLISI